MINSRSLLIIYISILYYNTVFNKKIVKKNFVTINLFQFSLKNEKCENASN